MGHSGCLMFIQISADKERRVSRRIQGDSVFACDGQEDVLCSHKQVAVAIYVTLKCTQRCFRFRRLY
jgi:hypothetical protein